MLVENKEVIIAIFILGLILFLIIKFRNKLFMARKKTS
jgi:hypothetical protein